VRESWATVYNLLADTMKTGARNAVLVTVPVSVATYTSGDH